MNTGSRVHGTQVGSVCLCVFCISAQRAMCAVSGLSVRSIVGVCVRVCVCVCVCTSARNDESFRRTATNRHAFAHVTIYNLCH
jgi:hypothetical protein